MASLDPARAVVRFGAELVRWTINELGEEEFEYESTTSLPEPPNELNCGARFYFPLGKPTTDPEDQVALIFTLDAAQVRDSSMPENMQFAFANEAREAYRRTRTILRGEAGSQGIEPRPHG